jgi:secretion/DNA translocation related TadE-like protein
VSRPRGDAGSASIWVLAAALLLVVVGAAGTLRGLAVLARHRVESAADLAALAAAARIGLGTDFCARAADIAARNGARLRSCRVDLDPDGRSGSVRVVVETLVRLPVAGDRRVTASARAGRDPASTTRSTSGSITGWSARWSASPHSRSAAVAPGP